MRLNGLFYALPKPSEIQLLSSEAPKCHFQRNDVQPNDPKVGRKVVIRATKKAEFCLDLKSPFFWLAVVIIEKHYLVKVQFSDFRIASFSLSYVCERQVRLTLQTESWLRKTVHCRKPGRTYGAMRQP